MSSRNLEILPSNKTTDGTYSYRNGQAQITFDIPAGAYLLDPDSLRIAGDFIVYKDSATPPTNIATNGTDRLSMNNRLGVYSAFQQLIWKSGKHHSVLEHNRHYNRWLSSYLSLTSNVSEQIGFLGELALTMPNYQTFKRSVVDKNLANSFCTHLPCGIMNGGRAINIMPNALGGLQLTIMLENDAQVFQVNPVNNSPTTAPVIADYTDSHYELQNVKLLCRVITPPPDQLSKLMSSKSGELTLQTIHSFYDTAQSSNMQISMNLGLQKVKSLFMNFISSKDLNNLSTDGFATLMPTNLDGSVASIKSLQFLKGGVSFPKHYPNNTNYSTDTNNVLADPEIIKDYINSVSDINRSKTGLMSVENANRRFNTATTGAGVPNTFINNGGMVWGIGLNFENFLGGSGIDLNGQQFGCNIDCELTSQNAQSIFLFVNAETSIVWNENGVQVLN